MALAQAPGGGTDGRGGRCSRRETGEGVSVEALWRRQLIVKTARYPTIVRKNYCVLAGQPPAKAAFTNLTVMNRV